MSYLDPTFTNTVFSPKHQRAADVPMNHAGRNSSHQFEDLRLARRAAALTRTRAEKYYHFKGLSPADLRSPHYIPVCITPGCKTQGVPDDCWLSSFPADFSAAPVRRFSKREAYEEAQLWPRPPQYHHTYQKDKGKQPQQGETCRWERRRYERRCTQRDIKDTVWLRELVLDNGESHRTWLEAPDHISDEEEEQEDDHDPIRKGEKKGGVIELPRMNPAERGDDEEWDLASISTSFSWVEV